MIQSISQYFYVQEFIKNPVIGISVISSIAIAIILKKYISHIQQEKLRKERIKYLNFHGDNLTASMFRGVFEGLTLIPLFKRFFKKEEINWEEEANITYRVLPFKKKYRDDEIEFINTPIYTDKPVPYIRTLGNVQGALISVGSIAAYGGCTVS